MVIPLTTDSNNTNSLMMNTIGSSGATLRTSKVRTLRDLQRRTNELIGVPPTCLLTHPLPLPASPPTLGL